ncbi:hypothetical protein F5Y16DRAFT_87360 [Xylariaceae sp. FL0255]|nr:hypothetical protein F5Y16DRAFT_87360 [Xylariaceae sp. FL0255]
MEENDMNCRHRPFRWQAGVQNMYLNFGPKYGLIPGGHSKDQSGPISEGTLADATSLPVRVATASGGPAGPGTWEEVLDKIFEEERIAVDESTWLPIFNKKRWYDCSRTSSSIGGSKWSIDHPLVWEHLSTCIELANRMILALINEQHQGLETVLYGVIGMWTDVAADLWPPPGPPGPPEPSPQAQVLLSYKMYKDQCDKKGVACPLDQVKSFTSADWLARWNDLLQATFWSFLSGPGQASTCDSTMGVTIVDNAPVHTIIYINSWFLELLITRDLTLAERVQTQVLLAITIIHELMHSLQFYRRREGGWPIGAAPYPAPPNALLFEEAVSPTTASL